MPHIIFLLLFLFSAKSHPLFLSSLQLLQHCAPEKRGHASGDPRKRSHQRVSLTRVISENRDIAIYLRLAPILSYSCSRSVRVHAYTRVMRIFAPLSVRRNSHGKTLIYRVGKGEGRGKEKGEGQHHGYPHTGYEIHPYIYVCIFARKCTVYAWMTGNPIPSRCGRS